jgi:hypothetical protein
MFLSFTTFVIENCITENDFFKSVFFWNDCEFISKNMFQKKLDHQTLVFCQASILGHYFSEENNSAKKFECGKIISQSILLSLNTHSLEEFHLVKSSYENYMPEKRLAVKTQGERIFFLAETPNHFLWEVCFNFNLKT